VLVVLPSTRPTWPCGNSWRGWLAGPRTAQLSAGINWASRAGQAPPGLPPG
jgi:hypothetical protein